MERILRIQLLGDFHLIYGDQPVTTVDTPRLQSFFAYLLLHRDAPQTRQHLSFLYWPDSTESQARTNLRNLLFHLREALPDEDRFLEIESKTLWWKPEAPFALDVDDFEWALERGKVAREDGDQEALQGSLKKAVDLYGGDLLPSCYDDWVFPERDRLRQAFIGALEDYIQILEDGRAYDAAIQQAQRLLRHDRLHEVTYRRLMRLHALNGDPARALRTYHTCADVLERELGVDPSRMTRDFYEQLLDRELTVEVPLRAAGGESPLVGRDQTWRELLSAWRSAEHKPVFALIKGEAGIGKTRLAEEFLRWAKRQRITGAITRSYGAEGELAYTPIIALLREEPFYTKLSSLEELWLAEITRLLPELREDLPDLPEPERISESWKRQRLFEACTRLVLSGEQSLVLVVDDLQWVDKESISWLHYLMDYTSDTRLLLLGTLRPEEKVSENPLGTIISDLRRKGQLTEIELDRLDPEATLSLAVNLSDRSLDEATATRLYRETEGNPLFVVEMVRAGFDKPPEGPDRPLVLPPKVQAVIEARLSALSSSARDVADVGAVVGREFTFNLIARALEGSDDVLVQGLDELWQRRIVRDQGTDGYDFSHDKFREIIYLNLSPPRRVHFHRKVAEALEGLHHGRTSDIAHRLAYHYDRAGQREKAIDYYVDAGDRARQLYAQQEAIEYYQRGLALLAGDENAQAVRLYDGLGASLLREAHYEEALDAYQAMRSAAAAVNDPRAQAKSWFRSCKVHDRLGRHHDALESAERAAQIAKSVDAKEELAQAILAKGAASYRLGDAEGGNKLGQEALTLSRELGDRFKIARSLNLLGQVHDMLGEYQLSQEYKEEALALFREVGDHRARWWIRTMLLNLANTVSLHGDYQAAVDLYQEALDTEVGVRDRDWEWTCLFNMAWARLEMGKYEEAERNLCEVLEQAGDSGWFGLALTHSSLAEARLELSRVEDALLSAQKAVTIAKETGAREHLGVAWRILGKVVSTLEVPVQVGDKPYQAEGCFAESEEIFAEIGAEPERARTLRAWARHALNVGDRKRGRSMWDDAREIFKRLGVTAEVESMDEETYPE